jgi:hypothetical protein
VPTYASLVAAQPLAPVVKIVKPIITVVFTTECERPWLTIQQDTVTQEQAFKQPIRHRLVTSKGILDPLLSIVT